MSKESCVFYKSFYDAIKNVPKESQLELYNAVFEYSFNDTIPDFTDGIAKAMFILMKPNIDSANARYRASVENGKKGGRPNKKTQQKPNENPDDTKTKPKQNLNDNVDVDVNVNDDVNDNANEYSKPTKKRFVPPTLEEVKEYCLERNNNVDAERFIDYYTANGWMVGKNKMKDWKAAVRTWEKSGYNNIKKSESNQPKQKEFNFIPTGIAESGEEYMEIDGKWFNRCGKELNSKGYEIIDFGLSKGW